MFVNKMPRYEILSEDAMETLDRGWRRIVSELGVEFLLEDQLAAIREDGFAAAIDELEPGLTALAAPVHGPTGDVVAALAISGPTFRLPPERVAGLKQVLTRQAATFSARLGHRDKGRRAA